MFACSLVLRLFHQALPYLKHDANEKVNGDVRKMILDKRNFVARFIQLQSSKQGGVFKYGHSVYDRIAITISMLIVNTLQSLL